MDRVLVEARQKMDAAIARWYSGPELKVVTFDGAIARVTDEAAEVRQLLSDVLSLAARFSAAPESSLVSFTHVALAWLCWHAHDQETARSHLESALTSLPPDDGLARGEVYGALARTACMAGDHRGEIRWLREWAAAEPPLDRFSPSMRLIEALQEVGEVDEAARIRAELRDRLPALPSRARARELGWLAESHRDVGDRAGAFDLAREALWLGTSNDDRDGSCLASFARHWSMSVSLQRFAPGAKLANATVHPDDSSWALQAWKELQRFEEQHLAGPRTDTLAALAELAWDGGDLHGAAELLLHPGSVDPPEARRRRSFVEHLVRVAGCAVERGQPRLATRLLNRALERARQDGHGELATDCWNALLAISRHG